MTAAEDCSPPWRIAMGQYWTNPWRAPSPLAPSAPHLTVPGPRLHWRVLSTNPVLTDRIKSLGLRADDFEEHFARSSGPGGQHVNKASTAVTVTYRPLGISVTAQETRSQYRNRQLAIDRLITLIDERRRRIAAERRSAMELQRRRRSPRPRALRREIRESKEHRSQIKQSRHRVEPD
jgi:protein subunit release factor B